MKYWIVAALVFLGMASLAPTALEVGGPAQTNDGNGSFPPPK